MVKNKYIPGKDNALKLKNYEYVFLVRKLWYILF